jgi:hypothetical protein
MGGQDESNFLDQTFIIQKNLNDSAHQTFITEHRKLLWGEAPITSLMFGLAMALNSCACFEQMHYVRFEASEVGSKHEARWHHHFQLSTCDPLPSIPPWAVFSPPRQDIPAGTARCRWTWEPREKNGHGQVSTRGGCKKLIKYHRWRTSTWFDFDILG